MISSLPMSTVTTIHTVSPIYRDILLRRLSFREVNRFTQEMHGNARGRRCSCCREYGHTIKTCCSDSTLQILTNICRNTNESVMSFRNGNTSHFQLRITLLDYFRRHSMKTLGIFASFIDCSFTHCPPTNDDKREAVIAKLIEMFRPINATLPPPPTPPQPVRVPPQPVRVPVPPVVRLPPPPPPAPVEPLIPRAKIHIHLNLQTCEKEEEECPICLESHDPTHSMTTLQCNHRVCTGCFQSLFMTDKNRHVHRCPLCRCEINVVTVASHESYYNIANMYLS